MSKENFSNDEKHIEIFNDEKKCSNRPLLSSEIRYCGFVAVIGEPNAGKSTLVNALTGQYVSLVSRKAHATRFGVYGIVCQGDYQCVFMDTPGFLRKTGSAIHRSMISSLKKAINQGDVTLLIIDVSVPLSQGVKDFLQSLEEKKNKKNQGDNVIISGNISSQEKFNIKNHHTSFDSTHKNKDHILDNKEQDNIFSSDIDNTYSINIQKKEKNCESIENNMDHQEKNIPSHPLNDPEEEKNIPFMIVLNKIDLISKEKLLDLATFYQKWTPNIAMISAKKEKGLAYIKSWVLHYMPKGPWLFSPEDVSQISQRTMAAEITRECLLDVLHEEIPYHLHVVSEKWTEKGSSVVLEQQILLDNDRYRRYVLGHKGQRIKHIGIKARRKMEIEFGHPVHLYLTVRTDPEWCKRMDQEQG